MCVEVSAVQQPLLISSLPARKIYEVRQLCFCFSFLWCQRRGSLLSMILGLYIYTHSAVILLGQVLVFDRDLNVWNRDWKCQMWAGFHMLPYCFLGPISICHDQLPPWHQFACFDGALLFTCNMVYILLAPLIVSIYIPPPPVSKPWNCYQKITVEQTRCSQAVALI